MSRTSINLVYKKFSESLQQFFPFENEPIIVVATSGGSDSLALCLLMNQWITQKSGKLISLTVDHGLRPDSTEEALKVNDWLTKQGIEHHILTWSSEKPATDIQNKARIARYHLLERWCAERQILHLALGHHADDQAETVLQRLLHGSGPIGLQGIQACSYRPFGRILRPLLGFSKQELLDYLRTQNQPWVTDPSNLNQKFERIKVRGILPRLENMTTTPFPFNQTAEKCQEFATISTEVMTEFFTEFVHLSPFGYLKIDRYAFLQQLPALQTLVLSHCLQAIGSHPYPFSSKQLSGVITKIHPQQNTTMGGCLIVLKSREIWIVREPRNLPSSVKIKEREVYWDNRFLLKAPEELIGAHIVPHDPHLAAVPSYVRRTLPLIIKQNGDYISFDNKTEGISWQLRLKNKLLP
ncbi:tRNA lysidine(34) synthetase TilS [Candidatus Paracaedibacter symbiosus]|uniref:tRNA lysidine(34) synthetase TilS n=1 Tax=Candidatus Paracaedibacter symbiosus TaxID=244582 RepID=UPI00068B0BA2|nr:tRNA lysidine(34) synthetase TilS [Candidatus Paracaedibacter symbiosus]